MKTTPTTVFPITLMLVSAGSMALEIVAGRALAPYVGMSLYSWTVIIAVVLAGLSIGHWIGGLMADRLADLRATVALTLIFASVTTLASLGVLKAIEPAVSDFNPVSHVTWLAMGAFFFPSAMAGIISPVLTKMALNHTSQKKQGGVLGMMFALGAFGAILGTLLAGLVLISWIGTSGSVALIAAVYALLSLSFCSGLTRWCVVIGVAVLAFISWKHPERLALDNSCLSETAYFCVRVDDVVFNGRTGRVMALDHLAHGVNDRQDPTLLLSPYVQGVDEIVRNRFFKNDLEAFFVGGGAYTLPRAWQKTFPDGRFAVVELDPEVTRTAKERLWFDQSGGVDVVHGDARRILQSLPGSRKFDVIFGDAFHDISIPPHLVSDEFHKLVKTKLRSDGLYVINVVDSFRKPAFLLSLVQTLEQRFPTVELWLDLQSVPEFDARVTWIVLATENPTPFGTFEARYGFHREWARAPIKRMKEIVGFENLVTLTDDYAPVDRLLSQVLLDAKFAE